jgi:undecaprenyl-diphosphatase
VDLNLRDAIVVGALQSVALLPGISRSGTTIVGGLGRGLAHGSSARFSFLLSIPAIVGAAVFNFRDVAFVPDEAWTSYVAGFLTAFAIGYVAIGIVIKFLASRRFHLFGYYCLAIGGLVLVYVALAVA